MANSPLPSAGNLFFRLAVDKGAEQVEELLRRPSARIERIVSTGQASPPGFWYDQEDGEWVVLLTGQARLLIGDEETQRTLRPGDWVDLPPHCRHRVEWTSPDEETVWLAVYYR